VSCYRGESLALEVRHESLALEVRRGSLALEVRRGQWVWCCRRSGGSGRFVRGRSGLPPIGGGSLDGVAERVMSLPMAEMFDFDRFVKAQEPVLTAVRRELGAGRKRSHWIWFIFPQLRGLGHSQTAQYYAIESLAEARAYLAHPVLGPRLLEFTELVNMVEGRSVHEIFGSPDDLKFHSSITLFSRAWPDAAEFRTALEVYFDGMPDRRTVDLIG
jgi:uncharacterized protein (DUF1810 family)